MYVHIVFSLQSVQTVLHEATKLSALSGSAVFVHVRKVKAKVTALLVVSHGQSCYALWSTCSRVEGTLMMASVVKFAKPGGIYSSPCVAPDVAPPTA